MLKENLLMLRNINGYTQEEVAEKIGVSRQGYAKWEKGETVPDVERCRKLAELYDVTIDSMVNMSGKSDTFALPPAPKGKHIFGTVRMDERGQIVIPKEAREVFNINSGDALVVLGDESAGIAVVKADWFAEGLNNAWNSIKKEIRE